MYPSVQIHENAFIMFLHKPLLEHGFGTQGLVKNSQYEPMYPLRHTQVFPIHVPSFLQTVTKVVLHEIGRALCGINDFYM